MGDGPVEPRELAEDEVDPRLNDLSAYQGCFGCGYRNNVGLRLVFRMEGDIVVTEFTPDERFQGFPGVVHGGILSTLLDEALSRTASAEGRWMMTGRLEVRFRRAAEIGRTYRITAHALSSRRRMIQAAGEIRLADEPATVVAEAEGTFLPIPERYREAAKAARPELSSFFDL